MCSIQKVYIFFNLFTFSINYLLNVPFVFPPISPSNPHPGRTVSKNVKTEGANALTVNNCEDKKIRKCLYARTILVTIPLAIILPYGISSQDF